MSRTEWRRLRRKAQKIQPVVQWWAIISALLSGGALACATNWLIAIFAPKPDKVSIIINGLLALGMAGIALVAFIADAGQRRRAAEDARELLEEMDTIERGHPETFPLISGPEQSAQ